MLVGIGVVCLLLVGGLLRSADVVAPVRSEAPTFQVGSRFVPDEALKPALEWFNAHFCAEGRLNTVSTSGATTKGHLDSLLPTLGAAESWTEMPGNTPIYGAVLQGDCLGGDGGNAEHRTVQGYMLFNDQGHGLYGRILVVRP